MKYALFMSFRLNDLQQSALSWHNEHIVCVMHVVEDHLNLVSFSLCHLLKRSDRKNNTPYWLIRKIKNLLARDRFIYIWNIYKIRLNIIKPLSFSCHWHYDFKKSTSQKIYTETSKCHLRYSILVFIYISSIVSRIVF